MIMLYGSLLAAQTQRQSDTLLKQSLKGYTDFAWRTEARDTITWLGLTSATLSSGDYAPFWLWAGKEGVSEMPYSGFTTASVDKVYTNPRRWMDYSFKFQPLMYYSRNTVGVCVQEAFAAARLYVFEVTAGMRYSDNYGYYLSDPDLTSGSMLFSHNAMPIPRLSVATAGYIPFPFLFGYLEVKAGLTHGWLGSSGYVRNTLLHHKYLGARVGGSLPVNITYEFHHAAQWGGISPDYGALGTTFHDYMNTFLARSGGVMDNDLLNAQGNHLCSQVIALDVKLGAWKASAYWQTISEDGPIDFPWHALNVRDGLWGVSLSQSDFPYISSVLYEYFNTTNQSGAFHDRDGVIYGGGDSYFTNSIYRNGWTYKGYTIGNPLILSPVVLPGSTAPTVNRVRAHHAGLKGDIFGYKYRVLATFSRVYDRYESPLDDYNHAFMLEVGRHSELLWGMDFKIALGYDCGSLFGKSFGVMFTIAKTGLIWGQK